MRLLAVPLGQTLLVPLLVARWRAGSFFVTPVHALEGAPQCRVTDALALLVLPQSRMSFQVRVRMRAHLSRHQIVLLGAAGRCCAACNPDVAGLQACLLRGAASTGVPLFWSKHKTAERLLLARCLHLLPIRCVAEDQAKELSCHIA